MLFCSGGGFAERQGATFGQRLIAAGLSFMSADGENTTCSVFNIMKTLYIVAVGICAGSVADRKKGIRCKSGAAPQR